MMNRHLRKAAVVTAAITAGLLMTACQNGSAAGGDSSSGKETKESTAVTDKAAASSDSKSSTSKGVSGTFSNGTVTYLAPGKYIVSAPGKDDQQFFVADDTVIWGYGQVCGGPGVGEGQEGGTRCTEAELETAAKKGFTAEVKITNGIATTLHDTPQQ
ncbi:hypothetical protein Sipo8835_11530 [Streptomyces ipomoeae]|uniref:Lipoprotein n=2 Tax=Streptomyces ipomoeae TaxID=103232 RepID=A0AAE9B1T4_9ACTN|nr:hypothetical protein Sipo8835_11530 [Streptomyces ipomoeae]